MVGIISLVTGWPGPSGFGSATTAEQVTEGIDASNLTVIITGGASGIGAETARVMAQRGAQVIIAARNMEVANETKKKIVSSNSAARVEAMKLDLNSLKSVREFADCFIATNLPLNILINNAGVMFCPFQLSEDGVEMQFATNHLGHFHLTNLLLEKIKRTAKETGIEGRIVNLSSIAHLHTYPEGIRFDGINDQSRYNEKKAYGQSKLANILHAKELSRRLQDEGANVTANSVHPGLIMTDLMRHSLFQMSKFHKHFEISGFREIKHFLKYITNHEFSKTHFFSVEVLKLFTYMFWKNVPQGAATSCYVALHPSLKGITGKYFLDCNEKEPSDLAENEKLAKQLWTFSEKLVKSVQHI